MGTAVGTEVFVTFGWRPAAALSVAWSGFTLVVMLVRGPHCARHTWFGYEGGLDIRKSDRRKSVGVIVTLSEGQPATQNDEIKSIDQEDLSGSFVAEDSKPQA